MKSVSRQRLPPALPLLQRQPLRRLPVQALLRLTDTKRKDNTSSWRAKNLTSALAREVFGPHTQKNPATQLTVDAANVPLFADIAKNRCDTRHNCVSVEREKNSENQRVGRE
jgi:hypothetical protein